MCNHIKLPGLMAIRRVGNAGSVANCGFRISSKIKLICIVKILNIILITKNYTFFRGYQINQLNKDFYPIKLI